MRSPTHGVLLAVLLVVFARAATPDAAHAAGTLEALELPLALSTSAASLSADGGRAVAISQMATDKQAFIHERTGITVIPTEDVSDLGSNWSGHHAVGAWISDDGETVVVEQVSSIDDGGFGSTYEIGYAYRSGTLTRFANLPNFFYGSSSEDADITGASADGSVAFGFYGFYFHGIPGERVYRWDTVAPASSRITEVCPPPYDPGPTAAAVVERTFAASADGSVVVGFHSCIDDDYDLAFRPFRWTAAGLKYAGFIPGGLLGVEPESMQIAANGGMVVGSFDDGSGLQSFYWPGGGPVFALAADLPGMTGSLPVLTHLSANSQVLIGDADDGSGRIAFRWEAGQLDWLGDLPGGAYESHVTAATPDGGVIVGKSGGVPFYWTEADGMRPLTDVLADEGIDLTGWELFGVVDLSDDGHVLLGDARIGGTTDVAFRAGFDAPPVPGPAAGAFGWAIASCLLAASGAGALALRARRLEARARG